MVSEAIWQEARRTGIVMIVNKVNSLRMVIQSDADVSRLTGFFELIRHIIFNSNGLHDMARQNDTVKSS